MNNTKSPILTNSDDELFELTWNEILYDGGIATWIPRSSFRWLMISVCIIGVIGKIHFSNQSIIYFNFLR